MRVGLVGFAVAALLWPAPAQAADVVGNPGPVTLTVVPAGGPGDIGGLELVGLTAEGTVNSDGDLLFPASAIDLPVADVPVNPGGNPAVHGGELTLEPTHDATGSIDPVAGAADLLLRAKATARAELTYDTGYFEVDFEITCPIGSASDPIVLPLSTEPLNPAGPDAPILYDQATGAARLVGRLSLPAISSDDCVITGGFAAQLASAFIGGFVGTIESLYQDVPVTVAARFQPPTRAPGYVPPPDPNPTPTPTQPTTGSSGSGGGTPIAPSNVFTFARLGSSAAGVGSLVLDLPGPGAVSAVATANVKGGAARRITVARARKSPAAAGRVTLRLKPTRAAKAILRRKGRLRTSVKVTFTPTGGSPRSATRALTFKVKRARR